jgi:inactivated superfamily I helicase
MGTVVRLRRPTISAKVIKELLKLGYLQPAKRHKPHVVERALLRLRADLVRGGVVYGGNTGDRAPATSADDQPPVAAPRSIASS